jgi:hypothetical protein
MSSPYTGSTSAGAHTGPSTQEIQVQGNVTAPLPQEQYPQDAAYGASSGDHGTPMTAEGRPDVEGTSVGQLLGEVSKDLSTLMRQELELAKAELTTEAKKAGQGAGMFGAAGFAGYMVLIFLSFAAMWGLAAVMAVGWAGLIVAAIWAVIGAVAFVMGRKKFQQLHPKPERTVDTLQQVPGALKPH